MNHQDVIEWKVSQLTQGKTGNSDMSVQMSDYLAAHADLQQELIFTESFYTHEPASIAPPSDKVSYNFYTMLKERGDRSSWLDGFKRWLAPNPLPQFVALAAVFYLGLSLNNAEFSNIEQTSNSTQSLAKLEKEVSSLTSLVAITMLQKPSASERLTGVAYSKRTGFDNPALNQLLIELLQSDSSTSVRLAIISALEQSAGLLHNEQRLADLALIETNHLVQMELLRLLFVKGSSQTIEKLKDDIKHIELSHDVKQFIQQIPLGYQA